jgi:guanylate kinase
VTVTDTKLGLLFVLIGPGGAGKNALMNEVISRLVGLRQLPTATTRPIRPNEQQGREHLFVDEVEFRRMARDGELLEWQEVHPGRFYGVPRATVEDALTAGEDLIADIEIAGAEILRANYPDNAILIFIAPPSMEVLRERMQERGENDAEIAKRMARAETEMGFRSRADYVIVNDVLGEAIDSLYRLISQAMEERDERKLQLQSS